MPMRMISDENGSRAAIFCDHCQQQIDTANDGNVEWRAIDIAETHFTHKRCSDAFRAERSGITYQSMELSVFPVRLSAALGVDLDEALESAEWLAAMKTD